MTCVVGIAHSGQVWIGADSLAGDSQRYAIEYRVAPKVFKLKDRMLIGYTTSFRMGQLLQYRLTLPDHPDSMSDEEYLHCDFIDAIRNLFKSHGFASVKENKEEGGQFLVGYRQKLYRVDSEFTIAQLSRCFDAVGSGEHYALGALYVLERHAPYRDWLDETPRVITQAIGAAAEFSAYVGGAVTVEHLPAPKE